MKRVICFVMFCILLNIIPVNAHSINVKLIINNTDNKVYVPSVGELSGGMYSMLYNNLPYYFICSYLDNNLISLLPFGDAKPLSVFIERKNMTHEIQIEQELEHSNIFLIFTKGDWKNIEQKMPLILSGKFLNEITPSFSYGLGILYPVKIILQYQNINIIGNAIFQKGMHNLFIENKGIINGKPSIEIGREI